MDDYISDQDDTSDYGDGISEYGECDYCKAKILWPKLIPCSNSSCRSAWYCSSYCQDVDWRHHRIHCLDPSELTSADRLALAVDAGSLPSDADILRDYGFARAQLPLSKNNLLGIFQGLIKEGQIDSSTIHEQRLAGTLIDFIKSFYEDIPVKSRGAYYPWFLRNQHLFAPPVHQDSSPTVLVDSSLRHTWWFTGGSALDTIDQIKSRIQAWPEEKQECFRFVQFLLHPDFLLSPDFPEWLHFGFCGCKSRTEETKLWVAYLKLVKAVSFEQFYNAYNKSSLATLFSTQGLSVTTPFVLDVLSGTPNRNKSVWNLKQFTVGDYQQLIPSVAVDYGFINCRDSEETIHSLKQVYQKILIGANASPLKLYEACIQGKLFQFAKQVTQVDDKFAPLMKNAYGPKNMSL